MRKKILVTGQCTLHWGRLEFGNIGNYYVAEPLFRELRRVFPGAEIRTTFQMSNEFCERENVTRLPMELYYGWTGNDLADAKKDLKVAEAYLKIADQQELTPYVHEVLDCDLFVDFSGDIWGDNADLVGADRFEIGLLKDKVAQVLGKKTAMIAGSPGPFNTRRLQAMAKEVLNSFDLVTNRESISTKLLEAEGFDVSRVRSYACPAFLFEPADESRVAEICLNDGIFNEDAKKIGFVLCGWNMLEGPYTKWPREESDFDVYIKLAERIIQTTDADIYFMSHSNGFELPPKFQLIHGRDYPFAQRMYELMVSRSYSDRVHLVSGLYSPAETKGILSKLDLLISGRVHAAVGALAQHVPTLIIDYGHEPKAHKLKGFADVAGVLDCVCDPADQSNLLAKFTELWTNREGVRHELEGRIPEVQEMSRENFNQLVLLLES